MSVAFLRKQLSTGKKANKFYYIILGFETKRSFNGLHTTLRLQYYNPYYIHIGKDDTLFPLSQMSYSEIYSQDDYNPQLNQCFHIKNVAKFSKVIDNFFCTHLLVNENTFTVKTSRSIGFAIGCIVSTSQQFISFKTVYTDNNLCIHPNLDFAFWKYNAITGKFAGKFDITKKCIDLFMKGAKQGTLMRNLYRYISDPSFVNSNGKGNVFGRLIDTYSDITSIRFFILSIIQDIVTRSLDIGGICLDSYPASSGKYINMMLYEPYKLYILDEEELAKVYNKLCRTMSEYNRLVYRFYREIYLSTCVRRRSMVSLKCTEPLYSYYCQLTDLGFNFNKDFVFSTNDGEIGLRDAAIAELNILKFFTKYRNDRLAGVKTIDLTVFNLSDDQLNAVKMCLYSKKRNINLILGRAGSGKSYLSSILVYIYMLNSYSVYFLTPTGTANNVIGKYLDKLQKQYKVLPNNVYKYMNVINHYINIKVHQKKSRHEQIDKRVFFIDEVSMVNIYLFNALIQYLKPTDTLIFFGDNNQLQSIGGDSVSNYILYKCKRYVNIARLVRCHRHKGLLSTYVNRVADAIDTKTSFTVTEEDFNDTTLRLKSIESYRTLVDEYEKFIDTDLTKLSEEELIAKRNSISIIAPYTRQVYDINTVMQNASPFESIQFGANKRCFKLYDPVICHSKIIVSKDVILRNGMRGIIVKVSDGNIASRYISVKFDMFVEPIMFFVDMQPYMSSLSLAYATTIHLSQGNQFKNVIAYCPTFNKTHLMEENEHRVSDFMNIQMFYVMITRTMENLVIFSTLPVINDFLQTFLPSSKFISGTVNSKPIPINDNDEKITKITLSDDVYSLYNKASNNQAKYDRDKLHNLQEMFKQNIIISSDVQNSNDETVIGVQENITIEL